MRHSMKSSQRFALIESPSHLAPIAIGPRCDWVLFFDCCYCCCLQSVMRFFALQVFLLVVDELLARLAQRKTCLKKMAVAEPSRASVLATAHRSNSTPQPGFRYDCCCRSPIALMA